MKKCTVKGCNNKYFAKGYCRRHYYVLKWRIKHNLCLDLDIKLTNKGDRNSQWKGGIGAYPNHYKMKLARIEKLKQVKGLCEICGKQGNEIHHIDKTKTNHKIKNLKILCHKCHFSFFHKQPKKTSKYIRLYGMTLKQMAEKYGGSEGLYYQHHKQGNLKNLFKS